MNVITTTRLTAGDWKICDWYRAHNSQVLNGRTLLHRDAAMVVYTRHTIKEPPKVPPRQAHCSCGAVLIVENNDDDTDTISA